MGKAQKDAFSRHIVSPATGALMCGGWPGADGNEHCTLAEAYVSAYCGQHHILCPACLKEARDIFDVKYES